MKLNRREIENWEWDAKNRTDHDRGGEKSEQAKRILALIEHIRELEHDLCKVQK